MTGKCLATWHRQHFWGNDDIDTYHPIAAVNLFQSLTAATFLYFLGVSYEAINSKAAKQN